MEGGGGYTRVRCVGGRNMTPGFVYHYSSLSLFIIIRLYFLSLFTIIYIIIHHCHHSSLFINIHHYRYTSLFVYHYSSLFIIMHHCSHSSLFIINHPCHSLSLFAYHYSSLFIIVIIHHYSFIIIHHYSGAGWGVGGVTQKARCVGGRNKAPGFVYPTCH